MIYDMIFCILKFTSFDNLLKSGLQTQTKPKTDQKKILWLKIRNELKMIIFKGMKSGTMLKYFILTEPEQ